LVEDAIQGGEARQGRARDLMRGSTSSAAVLPDNLTSLDDFTTIVQTAVHLASAQSWLNNMSSEIVGSVEYGLDPMVPAVVEESFVAGSFIRRDSGDWGMMVV
jgi:hypothetical protein